MLEETWSKKQQVRRSSCWLPGTIIYFEHYYKTKQNVSCEIDDFVETLCQLCRILRSRVLGVLCDLIKDVSPYWGEQNLTAVELSERTNTKYVAMDMYATLFILVGRNLINSSMRRGDKWSCITRWTLYHTRTAILLLSTVPHEPSDILLTCKWAVGYSFNLSMTK